MTPAVEGASPEPQRKQAKGAAKGARKATKRAKPVKPVKPVEPVEPAAASAPGGREEHRIVSHVNLLSVLKVSIAFYLSTLLVALVAIVSLWAIAETAGIIDNLEDFIADLLAYDEFVFLSFEMLRGIVIIGLVWVALATTLTVIGAAFYNLFSDLLGGVEITITDEPAKLG